MRSLPANIEISANVVLMLCHRLRRWPNIKTTLAQCIVFAWLFRIFASGEGGGGWQEWCDWQTITGLVYYSGCQITERRSERCHRNSASLLLAKFSKSERKLTRDVFSLWGENECIPCLNGCNIVRFSQTQTISTAILTLSYWWPPVSN